MEEKVVYIVGLGLIGASLAMGIRKAHPQVTLLGYNRSQASRDIALKNGIVDEVTADLEAFASRADVIIKKFLIICQSVLSADIPWQGVTRQELRQLTLLSLKMPTTFLRQQLRLIPVRSWN